MRVHPIDRLDELVPLYAELLGLLADAGAGWVQIDEPVLVTDIVDDAAELAARAYARSRRDRARGPRSSSRPTSATSTARCPPLPVPASRPSASTWWRAASTAVAAVPELADKLVVAGIVDGRNIWRTDLEAALRTLGDPAGLRRARRGLDVVLDAARAVLARSRDRPRRRAAQLAGVRRREGRRGGHAGRALAGRARQHGRRDRRVQRRDRVAQIRPAAAQRGTSGPRIDAITAGGPSRGPADRRRDSQNERLQLPRAADHDDRVVSADRGDPQARARRCGRARSTRPSTSAG